MRLLMRRGWRKWILAFSINSYKALFVHSDDRQSGRTLIKSTLSAFNEVSCVKLSQRAIYGLNSRLTRMQ